MTKAKKTRTRVVSTPPYPLSVPDSSIPILPPPPILPSPAIRTTIKIHESNLAAIYRDAERQHPNDLWYQNLFIQRWIIEVYTNWLEALLSSDLSNDAKLKLYDQLTFEPTDHPLIYWITRYKAVRHIEFSRDDSLISVAWCKGPGLKSMGCPAIFTYLKEGTSYEENGTCKLCHMQDCCVPDTMWCNDCHLLYGTRPCDQDQATLRSTLTPCPTCKTTYLNPNGYCPTNFLHPKP